MFRFHYAKKLIHAIDPTIKVKKGRYTECERIARYNLFGHPQVKKTIYISFKCDSVGIEEFRNYLDTHGGNSEINTMVYGILHEIGHLRTFNPKKSDERARMDSVLQYLYLDGDIDKHIYQQAYMDLPSEKEATAWAIAYSERHEKELLKIQPLIGEERAA